MTDEQTTTTTQNPEISKVMEQMAQERIEAQKRQAEEQVRIKEYNEALNIALSDPSNEAYKDRLREYAEASGLKKFGMDGFKEMASIFNSRIAEEKKQTPPQGDTKIPVTSADPGKSPSSATGEPAKITVPRTADGKGFNWLAVDLETVDPLVRNEVRRKQSIQKQREAGSNFGW